MFDEVTKREGGKRAAQRLSWIAGSTAVQAALIAGIIFASAALAKRVAEGPLVPVKLVRPAAPVAPRPPPPPPPPPAAKRQVQVKPKVEAKPRMAMMQPKEVPQELKPPDTKPPEPEEDSSSDEGVEGGVIGGVVGGDVASAAAPPPPPPAPAGPVKFNNTMTPPVAVAKPQLEYTQQALEREVEGTMLVECIVSVEGVVHDCRVLKSLPFMDRAVVQNLERSRYKPAMQGGKPVEVQYVFTIKLQLPR